MELFIWMPVERGLVMLQLRLVIEEYRALNEVMFRNSISLAPYSI